MTESLALGKQGKFSGERSSFHSELLQPIGYFLWGAILSAAAWNQDMQPIAMGAICAMGRGVKGIAMAVGGSLGYLLFWGTGGAQGVAWMITGMVFGAMTAERPIARRQKFLIPALAALGISGCGVLFLYGFDDPTDIPHFLLRVASAVVSAGVFQQCREGENRIAVWLAQGILVIALAEISPFGIGLGYAAGGYLGASGDFSQVVLSGIALDLTQITEVPMTAALCLGFCIRMIPGQNRWLRALAPVFGYLPAAVLIGHYDFTPLPGLLLGGAVSGLLPMRFYGSPGISCRTGEIGVVQVRLEQMAMIFSDLEGMLDHPQRAPDEQEVLSRWKTHACRSCPNEKNCTIRELSGSLLEQAGLSQEDLPTECIEKQRLLDGIHRGQEQLRRMKADRYRLLSYQQALQEQYGYLSLYLQGLSDHLVQYTKLLPPRFQPEVGLSSYSHREVNGDFCTWFSGTGNRYFVLLCDGMGTGEEAWRESHDAVEFLKKLLCQGFPSEYALRCLNSMAVLREKGACTTVDLLEIHLDTGKGMLYKWGAMPSYLLIRGQLRKIGTAGPPPGLSQRQRETADRLSLNRGEVLILLSDGAGEEILLRQQLDPEKLEPGEMAAQILNFGGERGDDATAAVVRLKPSGLSTR